MRHDAPPHRPHQPAPGVQGMLVLFVLTLQWVKGAGMQKQTGHSSGTPYILSHSHDACLCNFGGYFAEVAG